MRSRLIGTGVAVAATVLCAAALGLAIWVRSRIGEDSDGSVSGGVIAVGYALTGALLVHLRPRNAIGWLLVLSGLLQGASVGSGAYGGYGVDSAVPPWPLAAWAAQLGSMLWFSSVVLPVTVLMAVYPSGRLPSRAWRWPVGAVCVGLAGLTVGSTLSQGAYDDIASGRAPLVLPTGWWTIALGAVWAVALVLGGLTIWAGTVVRLLRARLPERQQLAWLVCVVLPLTVAIFLLPDAPAVGFVLALLVPAAVAVGVLRYRMLGIVVSRGLVYATLTVAVVGGCLTVAVLAGAALGRSISPVPGAVAAALIAVSLSPARSRLQAAADRLVYGERRDPVAAVARLGDRVAEADEADLLPAVLSTVTAALRAPRAWVTDLDGRVLATAGDRDVAPVAPVPLRVAGRDVGHLQVGARAPGEAFTAGDERLLAALAPQVAVVVRALQLARSLEQERDRVLAATHAERDRIRRELHDGLGPSLAGISLGVQAVQAQLDGTAGPAVAGMLPRLRQETDSAVDEVRRIIDGLRPGPVDELGLLPALRRHADALRVSVPVRVRAADLPPLRPDVEAAAYRIAAEALTNVARHAGASRADVSLGVRGDRLTVAVTDDGCGLAAPRSAEPSGDGSPAGGLGLTSMTRRAEELGGSLRVESDRRGTRVEALLPLEGVR
ncbi:sensor histidine kinase [Modestobacter altitudinis]|uniref:sensor histidine kinase n=1 Tax=Modestobacter altitudinis TaxID=2213158 RepID=UPI00110C904D|nr:GAF domain-containing sensor histidine kinase [Modestobacter altitudinis]